MELTTEGLQPKGSPTLPWRTACSHQSMLFASIQPPSKYFKVKNTIWSLFQPISTNPTQVQSLKIFGDARKGQFTVILPLVTTSLSLLRVSPIFPTRSALHTNTVQVEFTNTAQIQPKYKYNTAHEPSPALPMIAQFSRNYPRRPTAFYPKITHRQPLLIPTSAPFLWRRLYLMRETKKWQMQTQILRF